MSLNDSTDTSLSSPASVRRQSFQSKLPVFDYSESTTDCTHSINQMEKSILREYRSDFLLPCETHVAITRQEISQPVKQLKMVTVDLVVGYTELSLQYEPSICRKLEQHLDDDIWAEIMVQYDKSNDRELLCQLEESCCNNPELYEISRVEKHRNKNIVIEMQPKPVFNVINISRRNSLDSCGTSITEVTDLSDLIFHEDIHNNDLQYDCNMSISGSNSNSYS